MHRMLPALAVAAGLAGPLPASAQHVGWHAAIPRPLLYDGFGQGEIYAVEFQNRHVGWAVGGHGNATLIFRTSDAGATWERLPLYDGVDGAKPAFRAIGFADPRNGWMAGDLVLRTTDGGESWEPVVVEPNTRLSMSSLLVLSPDAVIAGSKSRNGRQIHITANGGASWTVATVSAHGSDDITGLAAADDGSIYATTASMNLNRGGLHRSRDGGRSWEPVVEGAEPLRAVAFHGRSGVAGGDGVVYWTADGGATWKRAVASGRREAVAFVSEQRVIAVGNRPHVLLSDDGGRTWRPGQGPSAGEFGHLVGIALVDPGWWFTAGGYGANAVFHYVDPDYMAPVAGGSVPLPVDLGAGDRVLPRGVYDVVLGHRGDGHVLRLERTGELPEPDSAAERESPPSGDSRPPEAPQCEAPCELELPVDVDYSVVDAASDEEPAFRLGAEPTPTGLEVVLSAVLRPPRDLGRALAALGAPSDLDAEAASAAASAGRKAGGLFGRVRKAAAGDLRGAVAGADPDLARENPAAVRSAPPAFYRIRLRHHLEIFAPAGEP